MDQTRLSADDLARLAEVEPAFVQGAIQAGALKHQEPAARSGRSCHRAARLSARAAPGEVLVSKSVADRLPQPGRLEPVGVVELNGVAQPLEVWRCPAGPAQI